MNSLCLKSQVYFADFLADELDLNWLIDNIQWEYKTSVKRGVYMYGKDYAYSGITVKGNEFIPCIEQLMNKINLEYGFNLNSCLLNYYKDGNTSIAWHSDNEKSLANGSEAVVVSVSIGATRTFVLRSLDMQERVKIPLRDGNILVMGAGTQKHYQHSVPVELSVTKPRINLTFREFV